jgi:soluble lytic murein transglycosylase-like protein
MQNPRTSTNQNQTIAWIARALCLAVCLMPAAGLQAEEVGKTQVANLGEAAENQAQAVLARQQARIDNLSSYIEATYDVHPKKADAIVAEAIRIAKTHKLDPELILAVIAVESTFREKAVSRAGARGLMQIVPKWHRQKVQAVGGSRALFDLKKNIHVGTQILNEYLALSRGNLRRALLRYNGSLGTGSRYADKVLRKYQKFKKVAIA